MGYLHERIILPLSDLVTGQSVYRHLDFLSRTATWSSCQLTDFQNTRLQHIVKHAVTHVPFYRDWIHHNGVNPDDIKTIADLTSLPIVDKHTMRSEGIMRFSSEEAKRGQYVVCHSSGTTGEPFMYYVSKEAYSLNTAAKLRTWYQAGYRLGDRYVKTVSSPRDQIIKKFQDHVNNCSCIRFSGLDTDTLHEMLNQIERLRPKFIRTHPNVAFYLALERKKGEYHHQPKAIMTTSSNLTPSYREIISSIFGCDVIDSYSCEGTANCAETPLHNGYQITREYGIIEILDNQNHPISNGIGRVVSTDLWNIAHPFIRYDTKDQVEVKDGIITRILGRSNETLIAADGRQFTSQVVCDFFSYRIKDVLAYQIVSHKDGKMTINLVVGPTFKKEDCLSVVKYWHQQTLREVNVNIVDCIIPNSGGKELTIINEQ